MHFLGPADDSDEAQAISAHEQIFAFTVDLSLRLAFSTVNDALGARPDAALAASVPAEVRDAVDYGRAVAD